MDERDLDEEIDAVGQAVNGERRGSEFESGEFEFERESIRHRMGVLRRSDVRVVNRSRLKEDAVRANGRGRTYRYLGEACLQRLIEKQRYRLQAKNTKIQVGSADECRIQVLHLESQSRHRVC